MELSGLKKIMLALVPKGPLALEDVESLTFMVVWALKRTAFMSLYEGQCQGYINFKKEKKKLDKGEIPMVMAPEVDQLIVTLRSTLSHDLEDASTWCLFRFISGVKHIYPLSTFPWAFGPEFLSIPCPAHFQFGD